MTTLTHTVFGIVLAKISMDLGIIPATPTIAYPIGIAAANFPDLDTLFIHFPKNHRKSVFHTPLFWLIFLGGTALFTAVRYPPILPYIYMWSICVFSHFVFDSFDMSTGIAWLAPYNKTFFNVLPRVPRPTTTRKAFVMSYLKHPVMIAETIVILGSIITFWRL